MPSGGQGSKTGTASDGPLPPLRVARRADPRLLDSNLRVVPRQDRARAKVEAMLAAADRLVAAEGIDAITTGRVAQEAGVSIGSVYRYLPNREALIEALAARYLAALEAQMAELVAIARREPVADPVGLGIGTFAEFYRTHPGFRALWLDRPLTPALRVLDRRHKRRMAAGIRQALVAVGVWSADGAGRADALAVQLAADAAIQEAFRENPDGDPLLLTAVTTLLRAALVPSGPSPTAGSPRRRRR